MTGSAGAAGVLAASAGRDRVIDAVKALALGLVVVGHGLAWTTLPGGNVVNTLEVAPGLWWLTWVLQILPLFFVLAGHGMRGLARTGGARDYCRRIDRLVTPVLPLLLMTMGLAAAVGAVADEDVSEAAGTLPTQLVWFLGVYLLVVAGVSVIARIDRPWQFALWLAAIGAVDWLRVNVDGTFGWANLVLVWALFAAVGMRLPALRALRARFLLVGLAGATCAVMALIATGPYSAALVSTPAVPGISNLAPPTLVLAFAGLGQACLLLLAWDAAGAVLARNRLWVPVAVLSSRAMELYLFHMMLLGLGIAIVLRLGIAPVPLGTGWWALHLGLLAVVVPNVLLLAPTAHAAGAALARSAGRLLPHRLTGWLADASPRWAIALAVVAGVNLLLVSESGLGAPLDERVVIVLPYLPAVSVLILLVAAALGRATARRPPPEGGGRRSAV